MRRGSPEVEFGRSVIRQQTHRLTGEGNLPSQGVARAAGFRLTGTDRRAHLLRDGTVTDLLRFDLLADECRG